MKSKTSRNALSWKVLAATTLIVVGMIGSVSTAQAASKGKGAASCSAKAQGKVLRFQCSDRGVQNWLNSKNISSKFQNDGQGLRNVVGRLAQQDPPQASTQSDSGGGDGRTIDITIEIGPIKIGGKFPCCKGGGGKKKKKKKDGEEGGEGGEGGGKEGEKEVMSM